MPANVHPEAEGILISFACIATRHPSKRSGKDLLLPLPKEKNYISAKTCELKFEKQKYTAK
jgi:hypothetical protein